MSMTRERRRYLVFNSLPMIVTMIGLIIITKNIIHSNRLDLVLYSYAAAIIIANVLSTNRRSKYLNVRISKTEDNLRRFKNFSRDFYIENDGEEELHMIKSFSSVIPVVFTLTEYDDYYELLAPRGIKSILKSYDITDATFT